MSEDRDDARPTDTLTLLRQNAGRALGIAIVLAATTGAFAYAGGFLTPHRLDSGRFANAMEANAGGPHPGFRRAHAKGICIAGSFTGAAPGRAISQAAVFGGGAIPVFGRLAEGAADPFAKDSTNAVRSMALSLKPAGGPQIGRASCRERV